MLLSHCLLTGGEGRRWRGEGEVGGGGGGGGGEGEGRKEDRHNTPCMVLSDCLQV